MNWLALCSIMARQLDVDIALPSARQATCALGGATYKRLDDALVTDCPWTVLEGEAAQREVILLMYVRVSRCGDVNSMPCAVGDASDALFSQASAPASPSGAGPTLKRAQLARIADNKALALERRRKKRARVE